MAVLVACALVPTVQAAPAASFTAATAQADGDATATGPLAGLRVHGAAAVSLSGGGAEVRLTTVNATLLAANGGAFAIDRDGDDRTLRDATFSGAGRSPEQDLDLFAVGTAATLRLESGSVHLALPTSSRVAEVARVDSTRSVLSADVGDAVQARTGAARLHIEGDFRLSVWSLALEVAGQAVPTGRQVQPVASAPTGDPIAWNEVQQVAQLQVRQGWLDLDVDAVGAEAYLAGLDLDLSGELQVSGAHGAIQAGHDVVLDGNAVRAQGELAARFDREGPRLAASLQRFVGDLQVGEDSVPLGASGALRDGTQVRAAQRWPWGFLASVSGLLAAAVVLKAPAQVARFNRIEARFEAHDYHRVLQVIDPFTQRARFRRRAAFLKAVSLLSLGDFREASLFLASLSAGDGPDAATKAFLQAFASAGQGQDATAIAHLTDCLRLDPTYVEELEAVPLLAGYLPYFALERGTP